MDDITLSGHLRVAEKDIKTVMNCASLGGHLRHFFLCSRDKAQCDLC